MENFFRFFQPIRLQLQRFCASSWSSRQNIQKANTPMLVVDTAYALLALKKKKRPRPPAFSQQSVGAALRFVDSHD
jgi:hypothetical protein